MILVHGHRGARGVRPENSLEAFEYAITVGADAIELDLRATSDDVLVVSHDPGAIRQSTRAELDPRIPSLDDVFAKLGSRIEWNLEVKSDPAAPEETPPPVDFVRLLLACITRHGMADRVMVESFDFRVLDALRTVAASIRRGALVERAWPSGLPGVNFVAPHYPLVTPEKVREAHAAAMQVIPWTVNRAADWARMVSAGVDAIITDDPAALIAWLR